MAISERVCEVCRKPVERGRCPEHPMAEPVDLEDPAEAGYLVERKRMRLRRAWRGVQAASLVGTLVSLFAIFPAFTLSPVAGVVAALIFVCCLLTAAGSWFIGVFQD